MGKPTNKAVAKESTPINKAKKESTLIDKPAKEKVLKEKAIVVKASLKQKAPETLKVSSILITQPKPDTDKSPYFELARKYNLDLHFHPFILVEGLSGKDFRKQRVDINEYTAIVFTSRNAVDHFFRICEELKVKVSQEMKYFCITEAVALYLQKFILYRKRKVFFSADGSTQGLLDVIGKHKSEKYILPTAESGKNDIHQYLTKHKITFTEAMLFHMVFNNIEGVMKNNVYDMIVFFSPFSVQALFSHDPEFRQKSTLIGAFGPTTSKAVEESGLRLDVRAPAQHAPSMVSALELFLAAQAQ